MKTTKRLSLQGKGITIAVLMFPAIFAASGVNGQIEYIRDYGERASLQQQLLNHRALTGTVRVLRPMRQAGQVLVYEFTPNSGERIYEKFDFERAQVENAQGYQHALVSMNRGRGRVRGNSRHYRAVAQDGHQKDGLRGAIGIHKGMFGWTDGCDLATYRSGESAANIFHREGAVDTWGKLNEKYIGAFWNGEQSRRDGDFCIGIIPVRKQSAVGKAERHWIDQGEIEMLSEAVVDGGREGAYKANIDVVPGEAVKISLDGGPLKDQAVIVGWVDARPVGYLRSGSKDSMIWRNEGGKPKEMWFTARHGSNTNDVLIPEVERLENDPTGSEGWLKFEKSPDAASFDDLTARYTYLKR